jgi:hypothetical protein
MAGLARHAVGVFFGVDLGEVLGAGSTHGMAANAERGGVEFGGGYGTGIGGMGRLRTVTCLAVDVRVLATGFHRGLVAVTGFTGFVPGVFYGVRTNFSDGGSAIVPVFSEGFGDNVSANHPEDEKGDDEEARKAEKVSSVSEESHPAQFSEGGAETWRTASCDPDHS